MVSEKEIHQSRDLLKRTHLEEGERGEGGIENKNPFCESVKQTDKQKVKREKRKFFVLIHKWCSSSLSYSTRLQENTTFFLLRNCFSLRYCVFVQKVFAWLFKCPLNPVSGSAFICFGPFWISCFFYILEEEIRLQHLEKEICLPHLGVFPQLCKVHKIYRFLIRLRVMKSLNQKKQWGHVSTSSQQVFCFSCWGLCGKHHSLEYSQKIFTMSQFRCWQA